MGKIEKEKSFYSWNGCGTVGGNVGFSRVSTCTFTFNMNATVDEGGTVTVTVGSTTYNTGQSLASIGVRFSGTSNKLRQSPYITT